MCIYLIYSAIKKKNMSSRSKKNRDILLEEYDQNDSLESLLEGDENPEERDDIHYTLNGKQKAYLFFEAVFFILMIASGITAVILGIITFDRVNDTKDEIQNLSNVFNLTDDTILVSKCGTIDLIQRNITVSTQMNLHPDYLDTPHFSKGSVTNIARVTYGRPNSTAEDRAKNSISGATHLKKIDYRSGDSIGFFHESMDNTGNRCNPNSGGGTAGQHHTYVLIDTAKTGEAEVYLCQCIQVGKYNSNPGVFPNTYRDNGNNNLQCTNPSSGVRPATYNNVWQERCVAQKFCYDWFNDNKKTAPGPVTQYNICSNIPK